MIEFNNVSLIYPNSQRTILENLNFKVEAGELVLVIGLTGAGKSSFIKLVNGLIPHHTAGILSGEIRIDGQSTSSLKPGALSKVIGIVGQNPVNSFITDDVESEIVFTLELNEISPTQIKQRLAEMIDLLGLEKIRDRKLHTLSGGEQQRVALACALSLQPKMLLLDEPTSALDPLAAEEILAIINRLVSDLGLTVIITEHRLERVIQFVDRVIQVNGDGTVTTGNVSSVLNKSELNPPLIKLAKALGIKDLPVTVRQLRKTIESSFANKFDSLISKSKINFQNNTDGESEKLVQIEKLSVSYQSMPVLHDFNLTAQSGETIGILGRNGAGKSTLLKTICGLNKQVAGSVKVLNQNPQKIPASEITKIFGYVPAQPSDLLISKTVSAECELVDKQNGLTRDTTLNIVKNFLPDVRPEQHPRDLSEGQKLILVLSMALATNPKILILDEPTRGVDYQTKSRLVEILKNHQKNGGLTLIASHDVELIAQVCNRAILIADGELIVDDEVRNLLTGSAAFAPTVAKLFPNQKWLTVNDVLEAQVS